MADAVSDILRPLMPIATGTRLGPYEIQSLVGVGGMGDVHKARDTRLNRTVAIKVLSESLSGDPQLRERFSREARAISSLSHPNICTLYDVGREQSVDFLVMEYLEGQTVADRLKKGRLPIAEALQIAIQIAEALDEAHRAGITHRDLKPGNVMLTKVGAKLLDFGLARTLSVPLHQGNAQPTAQANLTAHGTILGTLPYMAPELVEGADADARSDIWALGCLLYEMATGQPAFGGGSQASLITSIMSREPDAVATFEPTATPTLDRVIRDCLVKDPKRRWQSAFDLSLELKALAHGEVKTGAVPIVKRTSRTLIAAGSLVAVIAVALPAIWLKGRTAAVAPGAEIRFEVAPPPGTLFPNSVESVNLAISPDGLTLAFIAIGADGVSRLWIRTVAEIAPHPLSGSEGAELDHLVARRPIVGLFRVRQAAAARTSERLSRTDLRRLQGNWICRELGGVRCNSLRLRARGSHLSGRRFGRHSGEDPRARPRSRRVSRLVAPAAARKSRVSLSRSNDQANEPADVDAAGEATARRRSARIEVRAHRTRSVGVRSRWSVDGSAFRFRSVANWPAFQFPLHPESNTFIRQAGPRSQSRLGEASST